MRSTDFYGASFRRADLEYSEIEKCDFTSVDLNSVNLQGARLRRCNFNYSDLRGCNLHDCLIERCVFRGALFDDGTILPFDHDRAVELGMVYTPDLLDAG